MKTFISIFSISLFLLIVWQCNPMFEQKDDKTVPVSTVKVDLEDEKRGIAENLRDCSNNLDRRIKTIDEQIGKADSNIKHSLTGLRKRLVREKKNVDKSLKEVEHSSAESWQTVKKKASEILTDAKIETQKIQERVEDIMTN